MGTEAETISITLAASAGTKANEAAARV